MNELFLEIPLQPDFSAHIMCGSDELVNKFYEPLRQAYPNYISRTMIGTDTSGQYQMWLYDFCPERYEACVFLQSGVHPIETEGYLGLARIMKMIAENELPDLRSKVRFLVIPVVSVYGISKKAQADSIIKRYDIPHNVLGINGNRDCYGRRLNETKNVKAETIKSKRKMKTWEIALLIVGSPVWVSLLIAAFAALCSLYISIWSVIIALWAIFGSFVGVAFGGLAVGTVFTVCGNAVSGIALIGAGIILAGLSIFLFFGCKAATEGISLLTKKIASKIKSRPIKKEVV